MVKPDHRVDHSAPGPGVGFSGFSDPSGGGTFLRPPAVYPFVLFYRGAGEQSVPSDPAQRDVKLATRGAGSGRPSNHSRLGLPNAPGIVTASIDREKSLSHLHGRCRPTH